MGTVRINGFAKCPNTSDCSVPFAVFESSRRELAWKHGRFERPAAPSAAKSFLQALHKRVVAERPARVSAATQQPQRDHVLRLRQQNFPAALATFFLPVI